MRPGHLRSHLYLGLLYQTRGKLGLALEHLRVAGARRRVVEIEEALRRNSREAGGRSGASDTAPAVKHLVPEAVSAAPSARSTVEGPLAEPPDFRPAFPEAPDKPAPIAIGAPEARPLFKIRPEGGLEVASRGTVFVRKGCVAWYSGKIRFTPVARVPRHVARADSPGDGRRGLCSSTTRAAAPTAATSPARRSSSKARACWRSTTA